MASSERGRVFTTVNVVVAVLFLVSGALQWNDPDPWAWIALYAAAGAGCLLAARRDAAWPVPAIVALAALVWAAGLAPRALPELQLAHLAESMQAETPAIERSRELLGLVIVGGWCAVVAVVGWRRGRGR